MNTRSGGYCQFVRAESKDGIPYLKESIKEDWQRFSLLFWCHAVYLVDYFMSLSAALLVTSDICANTPKLSVPP
jgi:hypothetical protein